MLCEQSKKLYDHSNKILFFWDHHNIVSSIKVSAKLSNSKNTTIHQKKFVLKIESSILWIESSTTTTTWINGQFVDISFSSTKIALMNMLNSNGEMRILGRWNTIILMFPLTICLRPSVFSITFKTIKLITKETCRNTMFSEHCVFHILQLIKHDAWNV